MKYKILVVDDDTLNLCAVKFLLENNGYAVDTASSGDEAIRKVTSAPYQYGVVSLDYHMGGKDGAETAREILSISQHLYVLIHSGDETQEASLSTWGAGAVTFIKKSDGSDIFLKTIREWCVKYEKNLQPLIPNHSPDENEKQIASINMKGRSTALANIAKFIKKLGSENSELNVLILGENGSGKELIANAIHKASIRGNHSIVAVDCGAIAENLVESELFGHEKGAFTNADHKRIGYFQFADRGTLFLDEIGNISLTTQAKLLRVLQKKTIRLVGSNRDVNVDVRIISATNLDLEKAVREGKFREDLYYRLKGTTIAIPPLRERIEDIEPIVRHVCETDNQKRNKKKSFLASTVRAMETYLWPGNVRELENVVLSVLSESEVDQITIKQIASKIPVGAAVTDHENPLDLKNHLDNVTKHYVLALLQGSSSKMEAAQKAGMKDTTFRDLLKRLGLQSSPLGRGGNSPPRAM